MQNGIHETIEFLEFFFENLLMNKNHSLYDVYRKVKALYKKNKDRNVVYK